MPRQVILRLLTTCTHTISRLRILTVRQTFQKYLLLIGRDTKVRKWRLCRFHLARFSVLEIKIEKAVELQCGEADVLPKATLLTAVLRCLRRQVASWPPGTPCAFVVFVFILTVQSSNRACTCLQRCACPYRRLYFPSRSRWKWRMASAHQWQRRAGTLRALL